MSLRVRLIASIVIVLFVSLCAGAAIALRHAVLSVRVEMQAALAVGAQAVRNGIEGVPQAPDPGTELVRLVRAFDGDRHIHVSLSDIAGNVDIASAPAASPPDVPGWFIVLLTPSIAPVRLDAGADHFITVESEPGNEIGEVWTQVRDDLGAIGLSCGLSIVLVSFVVSRALRPLDRLSSALALVGSGDHAVPVEHDGPPEIARLAHGFNAMLQRLDAAQARNDRLNEQLLNLQEEERTDLARDLHDEVGPFLFAVNLDAAAIGQLGVSNDVRERAHAIRDAVEHMQRHVRAMLHRLRPAGPVDAGLAPALDNLVTFWRARQPDIGFEIIMTADEDRMTDPVMETIYRVVQEGLNNAIRHGRPRRIEVTVATAQSDVTISVADDGTGLTGSDSAGFGVTGMRERVERLDGVLHVGAGRDGKGFVVTARLPMAVETA
jgi:two-component system sensor histidine kinase UhpB